VRRARSWILVAWLSGVGCAASGCAPERPPATPGTSRTVPPAMSGDGFVHGDTATGDDTGAGGGVGATGTETLLRGGRRYPVDLERDPDREPPR
jgi:hypothetical protein